MRTHTNHLGSNSDLDNMNQDIAISLLNGKAFRSYGRSQHGLNGKDADLDDEGQCVIESIQITDPVHSDTMYIELSVLRYANICTPTDDDEKREEELQRMAEDIVMFADEYSGEWTGSDYWCFSFNETIKVPLTVEEYENPDLDILEERCYNAVLDSVEGKEFEKFAKNLNNTIDSLYNLI